MCVPNKSPLHSWLPAPPPTAVPFQDSALNGPYHLFMGPITPASVPAGPDPTRGLADSSYLNSA